MEPNFNEEKKLWKRGYNVVVGLDEAGRGPLAGPVVAAAVLVNPKTKYQIPNIRDSKKLSAKQREYFYQTLTNHHSVQWATGIVSQKVIDNINILQATKLAMQKALDNLHLKMQNVNLAKTFLLIDGNFSIATNIPQKSVIRGDQTVFSICAAGIIAKVTRDKIMQTMHQKYPEYGFDLHKGYGTALHVKNLQQFGPCKIHRKSFYPVRSLDGVG